MPTRAKKTTIKDLEARLEVLTDVLTKFIERQTKTDTPVQENIQAERNTRRRRRGEDWENTFVDDGTLHVEDRDIDQKLAKLPPVEKGTRKTNMTTSTCRECNIRESVPKQLVFDSQHTCQRCLRKKIGAK